MKLHSTKAAPRRAATAALAAITASAVILTGCAGQDQPLPADSGAAQEALPTGLDPHPLPEKEHVILSVPFRGIENFTPLFLAEVMGEYEAENLDIEWHYVSNADDLPLLGQGQVGMIAMGASASLFNAISTGVPIKTVFPGYLNNPGRDGLWVSGEVAEKGPEGLKGGTISSAVGPSSASALWIQDYMESGGLTINDVDIKQFPSADVSTALIQGAVQGGWIQSNLAAQVEQAGAEFAQGVRKGAGSLQANFAFGPDLLEKRPLVGLAVLRAMARTIDKYLQGDYKQDPDTVAAIAEALEITPEDVLKTPSLEFDPNLEIVPGFFVEVQEAWHEIGGGILSYEGTLDPDEIIDTRFVDAITGD